MGGRKLFVITLLNLSMKYANKIFSLALVGRYWHVIILKKKFIDFFIIFIPSSIPSKINSKIYFVAIFIKNVYKKFSITISIGNYQHNIFCW